jgi:hypothetical protein
MSTHTHNSRAVMMLRAHSGLHPVQTGSEGHNAPFHNIRFSEHEECVQKGFRTWYEGEISRMNISSEGNYFIVMSISWYSLLKSRTYIDLRQNTYSDNMGEFTIYHGTNKTLFYFLFMGF